MVRAFVTIDVGANAADEVLAGIRDVDAVVEAHVVTGDFDVIAEVEGAAPRDVLQTVTEDIRSLAYVGTTRSYVCLD